MKTINVEIAIVLFNGYYIFGFHSRPHLKRFLSFNILRPHPDYLQERLLRSQYRIVLNDCRKVRQSLFMMIDMENMI